jgi:hypothetical protein
MNCPAPLMAGKIRIADEPEVRLEAESAQRFG